MTHCSDDDLVLHYYGEEDRHGPHLAACVECRGRYDELASVLQAATLDVPERPPHYGLEVWQRIRHRLPAPAPWWQSLWNWQWAAAATAAVLLLAVGFTAGRIWSTDSQPVQIADGAPATAGDDQARRVLLLTVADHLDQSDRVLTDVVNARGGLDISSEQAWAVDLVAASRLYRQEALETNETSLAAVLDELERTLLEIVHRPSRVTTADVDEIRRRVDSAALLFKVRVMSTELRELTEAAAAPSSSTTHTIG
jgi:hypothetical protein